MGSPGQAAILPVPGIEIFLKKKKKRIDKSSHNEYTILAAKNADVLELVDRHV